MIVVAAVLVVATLVVMTAGWVRPVVALGSAIVIAGLLGIARPVSCSAASATAV